MGFNICRTEGNQVLVIVIPVTEYEKQIAVVRQYLLAKGYHMALAAFEFAKKKHNGKRKDGVSPEFSHQMFIALYAMTLLDLMDDPEAVLATIFLHDICEDKDVGYGKIERLFGRKVRDAVKAMTKKKGGVRIPDDIYYAKLAKNAIASVVKAIDRLHNLHSMDAAGWTIEKQEEYLALVFDLLLPMMKKARKRFTRQYAVYQNLRSVLLMLAKAIKLNLDTLKRIRDEQGAGDSQSA
jgi:(p)ppGpp synthase/HD superfamily hydrolase